MDNAGYDEGRCFTLPQFSNGSGVFAAWMVVPLGWRNWGSSPDFRFGRIIPNRLFPIHVEGVSTRNGEPFDPFLVDIDVPGLDDVNLPFDVDGHSHFPFFVADNADFGPTPPTPRTGNYTYSMAMTDQHGEGWSIDVSFVVRHRC